MRKINFLFSLVVSATCLGQNAKVTQEEGSAPQKEIQIIKPSSTIMCHQLREPLNLNSEKPLFKNNEGEQISILIKEICFQDPKKPEADKKPGLVQRAPRVKNSPPLEILPPAKEDFPIIGWEKPSEDGTHNLDSPKFEYQRFFNGQIFEISEEPSPFLGKSSNPNYFRMVLETASDLEFLKFKLDDKNELFFDSDTDYSRISVDDPGNNQNFAIGRIHSQVTAGIRRELTQRTTVEFGISQNEEFKIYRNGNQDEQLSREDSDGLVFIVFTTRF